MHQIRNLGVKQDRKLGKDFAKIFLLCLCLCTTSFLFAGKGKNDFIQLEKTVSGLVLDANTGNPLPGVTVQLDGTMNISATDKDGRYSIKVPNDNAVLVFTFIGYEKLTEAVKGRTEINVTLSSIARGLEEVVVVAYGTTKKINLTGSVSSISAKDLENRPVTNVTSALQGTMAGVTVTQSNGQPGRDVGSIRIRGIGTLNNSNPMVVVDGVVSSMSTINPEDIESISVLKDAASASIYGSRAANGVLLITTKKGKKGEIKLNYNAYAGKQSPTRLPDFVDSWQAATIYNQVQKNEGRPVRYTAEEIEKFKNGSDPDNYANTDWMNLLYQGSGNQQNHYLDMTGGSDKTTFLFSLGYFNQEGVVVHTNNERFTTRLNLRSQVKEKLTVNGNFSYTRGVFQEPVNPYTGDFSQIFRQANRIGRSVPYKYSNGYYGYIGDGNPIAWLDLNSPNKNNSHNLNAVVNADLEIIKGLHLRPLLGYRLDISQNQKFVKDIQFYDWKTGNPTTYQGPNSSTAYNDFNNVITLQALLDYELNIKEHRIAALAGYSQEYTKYNWLQGYRKNYLNNELGEINAGPNEGQTATGSANELALQSYFGRVTYNYNSKYLLEGNLRYDGSSRFASDNRWGIYPSVSAGWNISREAFFEPLANTINSMKIRGSWGTLGNQNITGNYPYISTISGGQNYTFGNGIAPGIAPTRGANSIIQWEKTEQTNIGLDAGFLNERLTFSAEYFIKNTSDILLNIPVGAAYGLSAPVQNAGSVQNKGWEFTAGYQGNVRDFSYNINANAAFINNKVTDLRGTGPIINGFRFMEVGYPINSFFGYESEGIFQTQKEVDDHAKQTGGKIAPGDLKYKDQNGDGVINGADRVYLGTYFPKITYGFTAGANFKGFDLSIFLQGAGGVKGFVQGEILGEAGDKVGKPTSILLDAWTADNPTDKFPRVWSSFRQNNPLNTPSSFWVRDASYLRIKNLQVGYTLPKQTLAKIGITRARIYYSGQNILTASQFYKWVDPEAPAGERGYTYPQVLVNTIGINLTF